MLRSLHQSQAGKKPATKVPNLKWSKCSDVPNNQNQVGASPGSLVFRSYVSIRWRYSKFTRAWHDFRFPCSFRCVGIFQPSDYLDAYLRGQQ
jgi:hypothetical protein